MLKSKLFLAAALVGIAAPSTGAFAQRVEEPARGHDHAMPTGNQLGELSFPNSGKPAAQAPFLRGVKLLHNFQYDEAAEAFREAQKADPGFALAYWGEAMTYNHPLWAEQDPAAARAALAKLGTSPDARAAKATTARERMWLSAVEALYGPGTKFERDETYADRMDALFAAFPNDLEARTFDALAIMGRSHGARDVANYMKAVAMLEEVFPSHRNHPGVVHYMIHAYDDPTHAPLGLRAARLYDKIAPSSAHAQHMTSHIFLAMGMWPEVEQANLNSMAVVDVRMAAHHMPDIACGHGPEWRVYALLQQGKDASQAIEQCRAEALRELAAGKDGSVLGNVRSSVISWTDMAVRQGIETGIWPKPLELPAGRYMLARFNQDYARLLQARDGGGAAQALADLKRDRSIIALAMPKEMPDEDQWGLWLDRGVAQAEAMATIAGGQREKGIAMLAEAAKAEAALPPPFGPPVLQKPSSELLADEYLADKRGRDAAAAYQATLAAAPGRRLSLAGLKSATEQGALASKDSSH